MIRTVKHLAYTLKVQEKEIDKILSNIDVYYYSMSEEKYDKNGEMLRYKSGSPILRTYYPSIGRLKEIQKRILKNILRKISLPDYAYGSIKGRDNIKNAKKHQGKKFNFTTDLRGFFPTITNQMVFDMYRSFNFSPTVAHILTKLTTYKSQLPQGTPTSPYIANLVFKKTGDALLKISTENNITFTSFVDDLTFSSPYDFKETTRCFLEIIRSGNYKISHKKTFYKTNKPIVTGIVVKNNLITTTDKMDEKLSDTSSRSIDEIKGLEQYRKRIFETNK